jgi:RNA polymerase sigma factor (sigma-70 family)
MTTSQDWNDLLAACLLRPSRQAWRAFLLLAYPIVMDTLRVRVDGELAKDLAQSLFLKLLEDDCRRLRAFDPTIGVPFPVYLRVITIRHHIDWTRGRTSRDHGRSVDLASVAEILGIAPDADARLVAREVREAVEKLPQQQRLGTQLLLEGMSVKEIARCMGLSEGGTAALLWRARENLRGLLAVSL